MRKTLACLAAVTMLSPIAFVGCDRTVSQTTTEHRDSEGNAKKETRTVTQDPAGNVTVQKEKTETKVDNR